jgi:hypothetical protein
MIITSPLLQKEERKLAIHMRDIERQIESGINWGLKS